MSEAGLSRELPLTTKASMGLLTLAFITAACSSDVEATLPAVTQPEGTRITPEEVAPPEMVSAAEPTETPFTLLTPSPSPEIDPTSSFAPPVNPPEYDPAFAAGGEFADPETAQMDYYRALEAYHRQFDGPFSQPDFDAYTEYLDSYAGRNGLVVEQIEDRGSDQLVTLLTRPNSARGDTLYWLANDTGLGARPDVLADGEFTQIVLPTGTHADFRFGDDGNIYTFAVSDASGEATQWFNPTKAGMVDGELDYSNAWAEVETLNAEFNGYDVEHHRQIFEEYYKSQGYENEEAFFDAVRISPEYKKMINKVAPVFIVSYNGRRAIGAFGTLVGGYEIEAPPELLGNDDQPDKVFLALFAMPDIVDENGEHIVIPVRLGVEVDGRFSLAMGESIAGVPKADYPQSIQDASAFIENYLGKLFNPLLLVRYDDLDNIENPNPYPPEAIAMQLAEGSYIVKYSDNDEYNELASASQELSQEHNGDSSHSTEWFLQILLEEEWEWQGLGMMSDAIQMIRE